jgi:hypothetical protein
VLINHESSIGDILLIALYFIYLFITLAYELFLHLLSTNHKCTQPCYFSLLLKPAAQKEKMDWNSLMRSSRLCAAPATVPLCMRVILVFGDIIYVIIIFYS